MPPIREVRCECGTLNRPTMHSLSVDLHIISSWRQGCAMRKLVILFVLLVAASPAMSRYQGVELEQVPVARLIENLEKISKENPNKR